MLKGTALGTVLGIILGLFALCFVAIVIEELFIGGRRRRQAEKALRQGRQESGDTPEG